MIHSFHGSPFLKYTSNGIEFFRNSIQNQMKKPRILFSKQCQNMFFDVISTQ